MLPDYIILLVVSLIGGIVGAFALRQAKKYRARKLTTQNDWCSSHFTPPGRIDEDLGFTPQEIEELKARDLIRNAKNVKSRETS